MKIIKQDYEGLEFDYNSLYLGNQKQLLIYRKCRGLDLYLSKYRLPLDFRNKITKL